MMTDLTPTQTSLVAALRARGSLAGVVTGRPYASIEDYVLDRGTWERSIAPTDEQRTYLREAIAGARFARRECFANAQRLAIDLDRLTYREGFAIAAGSALGAVLHAWCVLDADVIVDVTWRSTMTSRGRRIVGRIPDGFAYLGVSPVAASEIVARTGRIGAWSSYLDSPSEGWPMLREERR